MTERLSGENHDPPAEEVARRAYSLYLERGGRSGHDVEDWLRAEAELRSARQLSAARSTGRAESGR